MQARVDKLRAALKEAGLEGLLVTSPGNRRYLSGFTGSAGALLITAGEALLFTDFRYVEQAGRQAPAFTVVQYDDLYAALGERLRTVGTGPVAFEAEHVTVAQMDKLREAAGVRWEPVRGIVEKLRAVKEPEELELIQKAIDIADRCFDHVVSHLRPGVTEREVAWWIEAFMREHGAESLAFPPIVASGPNGAMPHARPSERPLAAGEFVTLDFGCVWQGYCSDMTRTVFLGNPAQRDRELYELVLTAQQAGISAVRPGRTGREVDAEARRVIAEAGYGDAFGHGLGHGIGLEVHEEIPRLSARSETVLEPGMVTSVEPGVYLPGFGGVRIEDLVTVTEDGCRVLTKSPKELLCLPV
ncbi:MAG: aminopeptidase P family protein [Firmicutes bacterium]|nr:aminopeptidase P family protein [Bacillota bacterium]